MNADGSRMCAETVLPHVSLARLRLFERYVRWYLKRSFHGLHLLRLGAFEEQVEGYPLLVCLNHPSWWDPLIALYLSQRFFRRRQQYAPIDAKGLAKYSFFAKLGFIGIDRATLAGAKRFLRTGEAALSQPAGAFWVTPQGAFSDVRVRPVVLEGGVGHLAHRLTRAAMLPVALEYSFWNERYPEAFAAVANPVFINGGQLRTPAEWNAAFASALEKTSDTLSKAVERRDPALFEPLLSGAAGVGGVYDIWRACKARLHGKPWLAEHGRH